MNGYNSVATAYRAVQIRELFAPLAIVLIHFYKIRSQCPSDPWRIGLSLKAYIKLPSAPHQSSSVIDPRILLSRARLCLRNKIWSLKVLASLF